MNKESDMSNEISDEAWELAAHRKMKPSLERDFGDERLYVDTVSSHCVERKHALAAQADISHTPCGNPECTGWQNYRRIKTLLLRERDDLLQRLSAANEVTDEMAIAFHSAKVGIPVDEVREAFEKEKFVRELILDWKPLIKAALKAKDSSSLPETQG